MKTKTTFNEYLQSVHAKNYVGTDDDMPDAFDRWITDMDPWELIDYADLWVSELLGNDENK